VIHVPSTLSHYFLQVSVAEGIAVSPVLKAGLLSYRTSEPEGHYHRTVSRMISGRKCCHLNRKAVDIRGRESKVGLVYLIIH
jgi:hypothetical protein